MRENKYSQGLSIIEIVVAAAIITTLVTAAAGAWQLYLRVSNTSTEQSQSAIMMEEAAEALRLLRDQSWTNNIAPLTSGTIYQLNWNGTVYQTTTSEVLIQNKYIRTLVFSAVQRNTNDDVVSSSGTNDPNTRKVTISVFLVGATSTQLIQSEMLIHNVYAN